MKYNPPIRSPYPVRRPKMVTQPAAPNTVDLQSLVKLVEDLRTIHTNVLERAQAVGNGEELKKLHGELVTKTQDLAQHFQAIKQGPPGTPGTTPTIDYGRLAREVVAMMPKPRDGKDAVINEKKIAKYAAKFVKRPKDGEPGKSVEPGDILTMLVEHLKAGKVKIKAEHVDGLEQTLEPIRDLVRRHGSIRGGGDTVTAGTNITVTRLASGAVQINATSAGITTLAATETPNGNRTTFTFSTATAKPSYLVVDNVWMKATSAAGTTNWTWNSGTKVATLSVPPTDDIFGIV